HERAQPGVRELATPPFRDEGLRSWRHHGAGFAHASHVEQRPVGVEEDRADLPDQCSSNSSGKLTWMVVSWPGALVAQMRPPCCSTICRAMYRPRPMPAKRRSSTFDPRKKR